MENSIVGFRCLPFADKNILEKVRKELTEHKSREMVLYRDPDDKTWCHALVHKAWYTEELAGSCTIRRKESQGSLMRLSMRSSAYNAYQRYLQKLLSPEPSKSTDFSFDSMFGEWDGTILVEDEEVYDDCGFSPAEQFLHEQTPAGIEKELNKFVLGQPELTRAVADFLYYHALRQTCPELPQRPLLIAGPSGSGKTEVAKQLMKKSRKFEKLISYTTDATVGLQGGEWYHYISVDAFRQMCESGEMFESTMYAGHHYGSCKQDVERILEKGKHVLTVMDICGAMSLKTHFPNVTTVYIQRNKRDLLENLLSKSLSMDEKVRRILALEAEEKNAEICDFTVPMLDSTAAAKEIIEGLFGNKGKKRK